ncbi:putative membrane protein [Sulfurospirillum multivorans DSM 12446]|uniref:Membrane protein n=2 Tax=Sulfurospirillum multivorans TaxID=66821 RepID=A0AA86E2S7_SULMK|nr:putative membrane protein [Sulfurospirillum multivorans DSM 12446]QEH06523.1 putative membrane protein [Sulfurospirillum multivorans]
MLIIYLSTYFAYLAILLVIAFYSFCFSHSPLHIFSVIVVFIGLVFFFYYPSWKIVVLILGVAIAETIISERRVNATCIK